MRDGSVRPWPDPGPNLNGGYCCFPAGSVEDVSIVEVVGDLIVFVARHEPESSAADQAELDFDRRFACHRPSNAEPGAVGCIRGPLTLVRRSNCLGRSQVARVRQRARARILPDGDRFAQ